MLFPELYKIMVIKVTLLGFRGSIAPIAPLDPPLLHSVIFNQRTPTFLWIYAMRSDEQST